MIFWVRVGVRDRGLLSSTAPVFFGVIMAQKLKRGEMEDRYIEWKTADVIKDVERGNGYEAEIRKLVERIASKMTYSELQMTMSGVAAGEK